MTEPRTLIPALLLAGMLAPGVVAQDNTGVGEGAGKVEGEAGVPKRPGGGKVPKPEYVYRPSGVVEIKFHADETQTERIVPPAEVKRLRAKNLIPKIHGKELFAATVSTRPRQLAPGETGMLHVLVTLANDTVVLPNSTVSLDVFGEKLPVTLGASKIVPPKNGTLPGRFRGTPVHDNIVEIRTPITIKANAEAKKYPIPGHVELEAHSAETGRLIGVFYSGIDGWLTVGRSLATSVQPRKRNPGEPGAAPSGTKDRAPDGTTNPKAAGPESSRGDGTAKMARTEGVGSTPDPETGTASEPDPPAVSMRLVIGVGGFVLLALIFVLLGRSKN